MTVNEQMLARYLEALLEGNRGKSRRIIEEMLQSGITANSVYVQIIWPVMVEIEKLLRNERITSVEEHLATRINRSIVDQLQNKLPRREDREKKITICCAPDEAQELGAQMMADLFESDGWEIRFLGGGLSNDEILAFVNGYAPDILAFYGTSPRQAPALRELIDTIRDVNAWPEMRILVSGGLFNRAEGLWQEMGADMFAETALEALDVASSEARFEPEDRTINRRKKKYNTVVKEARPLQAAV
jgi:methanogenic corrinoid protein MtbC1